MITIGKNEIGAILLAVFDAVPGKMELNYSPKIARIKMFRSMTGYGLWEAKTLCEAEEARRDPLHVDYIGNALEAIRQRKLAA